jgi:hypothetical protein
MSSRWRAFRWAALCALAVGAASCDLITDDDFDDEVTGQFEGQLVETRVITATGPTGATTTTTCRNTFSLRGSLVVEFDRDSDGGIEGRARVIDTGRTETALSGPASCAHMAAIPPNSWTGPVTGSTSELRFRSEQVTSGSGGSLTNAVELIGVLDGGLITGVLTFSVSGQSATSTGNGVALSGSTTIAVTLQ